MTAAPISDFPGPITPKTLGEGARMPAHDLEAEAAVLSAVMLDPDAPAKVAPLLRPESFYAEAHRRIYEAAIALWEAGQPVDVVHVGTWLRDHGRLGQVGGMPYVTQLLAAAPAVANVVTYAETVARKARVRRVQQVAQRLTAEAYAPIADEDAWIDRAEQLVHEVGAASARRIVTQTLRAALREAFEVIQQAAKNPGGITGMSYGFPEVDDTTGGLQAGELDILAGRPGMGKTALAMNVALTVARQGKGVLFFSLEMPNRQIATRGLCSEAGVDGRKARTATFDMHDWRKLTAAAGEVSKIEHFELVEQPCGLLEIRSVVRDRAAAWARAGVKLGLVVVDYLQIMQWPAWTTNREEAVSHNAQGLKDLAKDEQTSVVALAQLNRGVEQRPNKRPLLGDLRESGGIEQAGDRVSALYRDDYYHADSKRPGIAEWIFLKNRNGPTTTVEVGFRAASTTFYPLSPDRDQGPEPERHWSDT